MKLGNPNLDLTQPIISSIYHKFSQKPTSNFIPISSNQSLFKLFSHSNAQISFSNKSRESSVFCSVFSSTHENDTKDSSSSINRNLMDKLILGFAAGAFAMASIWCCDSPALAESLTIAFPVSRSMEVNRVQRTLIEAWGLIRESFIDPTFNHQDWDLKLQQTMVEMFPLKSADAAYNKISGMVSSLGDPFTRIISPKVVVSCVEDSPAAHAGIHEGDELVEINGERVDGIDSETAALKLRGRAGTTVRVKVRSVLTDSSFLLPSR